MKDFKEWRNADLKLFRDRKDGAQKIASQSDGKGPGQLTAWHFKAKLPQYTAALSVLQGSSPEAHAKNKVKTLVTRLHRVEEMTQREFQELMGEIEVWGEVLIQIRKPQTY